ncbi:hypothetical protein [Streptomyces sp. NPDC059816]|uniref:hypothetical protein n=1 Tax=Streptomyces sp. NPDC059816 TaxID=3346960 RepID=UPI0036647BC3
MTAPAPVLANQRPGVIAAIPAVIRNNDGMHRTLQINPTRTCHGATTTPIQSDPMKADDAVR